MYNTLAYNPVGLYITFKYSDDHHEHGARAMKVYRFRSEAAARSFRDRAADTMLIMLGDDGRYWVAMPATAARLERAGHEIIG